MPTLDMGDIQGIIVRGYGEMEAARFAMLTIQQPAACKAWLREIAGRVRSGDSKPGGDETCVNVAFTYPGLQALGVAPALLSQFSIEFREGMVTPHRTRQLGDQNESDPQLWQWGAPGQPAVHMLLMLYAKDDSAADALYQQYQTQFAAASVQEVHQTDGIRLAGRKEHFGFRDGIAQPDILGQDPEAELGGNTVAAGEFLLGYKNAYDQYPGSPTMPVADDPMSLLRNAPEADNARDFGRNGSYLVFRQLQQDVSKFWRFLDGAVDGDVPSAARSAARVALASKMVGRWPSGAPLTKSPDADTPGMEDDDAFLYHDHDAEGLMCPVGAHVRRTNQRDAVTPDPEQSLQLSNLHRIIRRGRPYGPPADPSMDPDKLMAEQDSSVERGLNFLCFNANIARQFEFVQNTWVNNHNFSGLYNEPDPLMGNHEPPDWSGQFTIPGHPVRQRITGIPNFVKVRGGAYFFMPSIRALQYLSRLT